MSKAMNALIKKLKKDNFAHAYLDNGILAVPRLMAMDDHGLPVRQYLTTTIFERDQVWSIIIQGKIRKICEEDKLYSLENTRTIMEEIRNMMEKQYPCIDKAGQITLDWTVDYDSENLIGEEKFRIAVVEASVGFVSEAGDVYGLLKELPNIHEITLVREEAKPAILEA